jgi:hypothetical protein
LEDLRVRSGDGESEQGEDKQRNGLHDGWLRRYRYLGNDSRFNYRT